MGVAIWLACAGCHYQGSGTALLRAPSNVPGQPKTEGQIAFKWDARGDASTGHIQAVLPDGRKFSGTFVQPTSTTWLDGYQSYWMAWSGPWGYGRPWYSGPRNNFAVTYSGKVLAHLEGPDATRMRCELSLYNANAGLNGGGEGQCQLSTNEEAFAVELRRD